MRRSAPGARKGGADPRTHTDGGGRLESLTSAVLLVTLLAVLGAQLLAKRSTSVNGCDSYSYLQGAVVMARDGILHTALHDPLIPDIVRGFGRRPPDGRLVFLLSPHGHYVHDLDRGVVYSVFPPGMSWLLLPLVKMGGLTPVFLFLPLLTLAFGAVFFVLGARRIGPLAAVCAAAFVVSSWVVFENAVWIMSDVPSMVLVTAAAALLYLDLVRPRLALPLAAGACFGFGVAVRYSNALAVAPVVFLLALAWRHDRRRALRAAALFGCGVLLLGVIPLAAYTYRQFGTVLRLTYEPTTMSRMSLANLGDGVVYYARSLTSAFGLLGLAVAAAGVAACVVRRQRRAVAIAGLLGLGAFFLFFSLNSIRHDRYLMPAYPWLALFYGYGAVAVAGVLRFRGLRLLAIGLLAAAPLWHSWPRYITGNRTQEGTCRRLAERVGGEAAIFCDDLSGPVRLYAGLPGYRFTWTRREVVRETCDILLGLGHPVYFLLEGENDRRRFERLAASGALTRDRLVNRGEVDGLPLWEYVGAPITPPALE